jgi:hypothetical protein
VQSSEDIDGYTDAQAASRPFKLCLFTLRSMIHDHDTIALDAAVRPERLERGM